MQLFQKDADKVFTHKAQRFWKKLPKILEQNISVFLGHNLLKAPTVKQLTSSYVKL